MSASVLALGLAACNDNDNNNAMDHGTGTYNVRDNNLGDRNNRDRNNDLFGMDHEGLLTEEWNPGHNDDDRNGRFGAFGDNDRRGKDRDRRFNMDNLSSIQTDMNSRNYPETRAILVQQAKYQFVRVDPRTGQIQQGQLQQMPGQGQFWQISLPQNSGAQPPVMNPGFNANQQGQMQGPQQPAPQQGQAPAPQQGQAPAPQQAQPTPAKQQGQAPAKQQQAPTAGIGKFEQQVIDLTNVQRQQNGLPPLKADTKLSGVAEKKSLDMQQKNYFSHTSPTYGSPFDMMRDFGVTYRSAGENIAMGQRTPQEVVQAWMNSEGHRRNILNKDFTHIGVGFEQSGYHWTQMFISK